MPGGNAVKMTRQDLQLPGLTLSVRQWGVAGNRPTLVLLHYFGGSSLSWQALIPLLEGNHVVALDLRGFGDSAAPPDGYSTLQSAHDVLAATEQLGLVSFVLVGHSMGGKIALRLAALQPAGLRGLALLAPSPPTPEPMPQEARQELEAAYGNREAAGTLLAKICARPLTPALQRIFSDDHARSSKAAWQAWLQHGSREDIAAETEHIQVPAVVLAGAEDATMTPDLLQTEVVNRLRDARMRVAAGAAHLLPMECPEEVAAALAELSSRIEARATS